MRSCWTWMPPMIRCTGTRRGASSTATTMAYCYLPLYIFCGEHLLCAKLRRAEHRRGAGAREEVERIVAQIREHWPQVRIILRADSGFCARGADELVRAERVDYLCFWARRATRG